jgi:hypothetical protein
VNILVPWEACLFIVVSFCVSKFFKKCTCILRTVSSKIATEEKKIDKVVVDSISDAFDACITKSGICGASVGFVVLFSKRLQFNRVKHEIVLRYLRLSREEVSERYLCVEVSFGKPKRSYYHRDLFFFLRTSDYTVDGDPKYECDKELASVTEEEVKEHRKFVSEIPNISRKNFGRTVERIKSSIAVPLPVEYIFLKSIDTTLLWSLTR